MNTFKITLFTLSALFIASCGGNGNSNQSLAEGASGNMDEYVNDDVNAIQQALPQIMVIPADQTLKNFGALKETTIEGKKFIVRIYAWGVGQRV